MLRIILSEKFRFQMDFVTIVNDSNKLLTFTNTYGKSPRKDP